MTFLSCTNKRPYKAILEESYFLTFFHLPLDSVFNFLSIFFFTGTHARDPNLYTEI